MEDTNRLGIKIIENKYYVKPDVLLLMFLLSFLLLLFLLLLLLLCVSATSDAFNFVIVMTFAAPKSKWVQFNITEKAFIFWSQMPFWSFAFLITE